MTTNSIASDKFDNILMAGQANIKPFGKEDGIPRGFLMMMDQRAAFFWVYGVESIFSSSQ